MYDCVNYNLQMHVRDVPPTPPPSPQHWKKQPKTNKSESQQYTYFSIWTTKYRESLCFLGVILWILNVLGGSKNKNEQDDSG